MIDALGGIPDTVAPMEETLRKHELANFHIRPNYRATVSGLNMYDE